MAKTTKPLGELSERSLRQVIRKTEAEIAALPENPAPEDARRLLGEVQKVRRRQDAAEHELQRRAELQQAHNERTARQGPLRRRVARASALGDHPASWALFAAGTTLALPELQGEQVVASRLTGEEGRELGALVSRRIDGETLGDEETRMLETYIARAAGDEDLFRRKRERAKLRAGLEARKASARRDPRAQSVTAALFSSEWLADAVIHRLRDNVRLVDARGAEQHLPPGEFTSMRLLQPGDMSTLALVAFAIQEASGLLSGASPDRGLRDLPDVRGSLRRLQLAKLVTVVSEGDFAWRVSWGERALQIAREAGVQLPHEEVPAAASR